MERGQRSPSGSSPPHKRHAPMGQHASAEPAAAAPYVPRGFVARPEPGTGGRKIIVNSNHYLMGRVTKGIVYHYDVDTLARKIFIQLLKQYSTALNNSMVVFDGMKNIFSPVELQPALQEFNVDLADAEARAVHAAAAGDTGDRSPPKSDKPGGNVPRKDDFLVRVRRVATVNMEELERFLNGQASISGNVLMAINVINVVLNHSPMFRFLSVIKGTTASFFPPQSNVIQLSGGLEAWKGFFQSARPGVNAMTVNVDVATACFYKGGQSLAQYAGTYFRMSPTDLARGLAPHQVREFNGFVKLLTIQLQYARFQPKKKIMKLSDKSAEQITFSFQRDEATPAVKISVAEYFQQRYNVTLKFPNLQCVLIGPKLNAVPLEMCYVVEGQRYPRQINAIQLAEMKTQGQRPDERKKRIEGSFQQLNYENDPVLKAFQMSVEPQMVNINARLLPCPQLQYGANKMLTPRDGAWNLRDIKLHTGSKLHTFGVFNMATYGRSRMDDGIVQHKMREFLNMFERCGIQCHPELKKGNFPIIPYNDRQGPLAEAFTDAHRRMQDFFRGDHHPSIIFVLLADKTVDKYAEIKCLGEIELGVATQCMQGDKVMNDRGFPQYAANIALKINVKLQASPGSVGINVQVSDRSRYFDGPVMVMGADVSHPGPGSHGAPSIAGVVASMDESCTRFMHEVRYQPGRVEDIQEMEDLVTHLLNKFGQRRKVLPQRILVFRDGVSDGQYERVRDLEVGAIQRACAKMGVTVHLTFIVVKKRHHTRFFASDRRDTDKSGNVLPGLVVDALITHPTDFDFFLQSQAGLLGTSRPTHYYVIHDDYKFSSDELQKITYNMCFTYARATRSVSIVPAAYYAHLICFRARYYVRGALHEGSSDSGSSDTLPPNIRVHPKLIDSMFFM